MAEKKYFLTAAFLLLSFGEPAEAADAVSYKLPKMKTAVLEPYSSVDFKPVNEGSAFAASGLWKGVFWTLNDSGGDAAIFPVNKKGEIIKPPWYKKYAGVKVLGAHNVDWEAMCADDKGNLIIADTGNNENHRRDLTLFWVPEPYPWEAISTHILKKVMVFYPEQKEFPSKLKNFDCEAIVYYKGRIYLFTKNRSDTKTALYRLDKELTGEKNPLTYVSAFDARSMVTAATLNEDKTKLALLTYKYIWLFNLPSGTDDFFRGDAYVLPIEAAQCEGVAFDGNEIIVSNEQRSLFRIKVKDFVKLRKD